MGRQDKRRHEEKDRTDGLTDLRLDLDQALLGLEF